MENYISFMFKEDTSEYFPKFFEITEKIDEERNQSFGKTFPELSKILERK